MTHQPTTPPQGIGNASEGQSPSPQPAPQPQVPTNTVPQSQYPASASPQTGFVGGAPAKPKKKKKGCLIAVLVVVALAVIFGVTKCVDDMPDPIEWPTTGLATVLPEPPTDKGEIIINSDTSFSADIAQCSQADYDAYVESCKEKGFAVDAENGTNSYDAYSSEGHRLSLNYWKSNEEISISLEAPKEMGELAWPKSGPGALLPAPNSTKGNITVDNSTQLTVLVGDTSPDDFKAYADACSEAGFDVDYSSSDKSYSADNKAGDSLFIGYEGFNTMRVSVTLADESHAANTGSGNSAQDDESGDDAPKSDSSKDAPEGVSPDFKASMDEYEEFFDKYVEFMKKYDENSSSPEWIADYADMMAQYSDAMDALNAIDEDSLSDADLAYYLEVTARINQKLLEI